LFDVNKFVSSWGQWQSQVQCSWSALSSVSLLHQLAVDGMWLWKFVVHDSGHFWRSFSAFTLGCQWLSRHRSYAIPLGV